MFRTLELIKRSRLLRKLFKPEIYPEVFFANFHKLPSRITVEWFKDEGMIIGKVMADGKEFMTQGANADEFVEMVNESIITVFDVPYEYFDIIKQSRSYSPPSEEYEKLKTPSVLRGSIGFVKKDNALKFA